MPPSNRQEIAEYQQYLLSQGHSPSEVGEYGDYLVSQLPDSTEDKIAKFGIGAAGRLMSIPGGTLRAAALSPLAKIADEVNGTKNTSILKDLAHGLIGSGPKTEEYLTRMGVGDLGSMRLPDWMTRQYKSPRYDIPSGGVGHLPSYTKEKPTDITGKNVLGFTGDVASDIAGTKGAAAAFRPIAESVGGSVSKFGEGMFKNAFGKYNQIAKHEGKMPLGQLAWEEGLTPKNSNELLDDLLRLKSEYRKVQSGAAGKVEGAGLKGNIRQAMDRAQGIADELLMSEDSKERALGGLFQKELDRMYGEFGERAFKPEQRIPKFGVDVVDEKIGETVTPKYESRVVTKESPGVYEPQTTQEVQLFRSGQDVTPVTRKRLQFSKVGEDVFPEVAGRPDVSYGRLGRIKGGVSATAPEEIFLLGENPGVVGRFKAAQGAGTLEQMANLAEAAEPGLGETVLNTGHKQSAITTVLDDVKNKAVSEAAPRPLQMTGMAGAINPKAALLNELGRELKYLGPRTSGGRALYSLGTDISTSLPNLADSIAKYSPWTNILLSNSREKK